MRKFILLLSVILMMGMASAENEPRNLRLRFAPQQTSADSLTFDLKWNAPTGSRGATPITGYEWEFLRSRVGATVADSVVAFGTTAANEWTTLIDVPLTCGQTINYQARVKAIGNWDTEAPWGTSNAVSFYCPNLPPGAPIVTLDTISGGQ